MAGPLGQQMDFQPLQTIQRPWVSAASRLVKQFLRAQRTILYQSWLCGRSGTRRICGTSNKAEFSLFVEVYRPRLNLEGVVSAFVAYDSSFHSVFQIRLCDKNIQKETGSVRPRIRPAPPFRHQMMDEPTSVPSAFEARKTKILADLAIPDAEYTDLSPKGSVDEGIRDLIRDINGLPGLVTTSSCAGRISVFLEGRKKQPKASEEQQQQQQQQRQFVPSGGKGAGKWLYVSHDPLEEKATSLHERFSLNPGDGRPLPMDKAGRAPRLVRFHYEPMILHIMAATLHHASPVLSAASSSGFRESGLQSLRCLDGDDDGPSPIVAVRSAGLSLESVIGYCEDADEDEDGKEPVIYSLVTEEYLQMLVAISNERFSINAERKARFRTSLLQLCSPSEPASSKTKGKLRPPGWEDPEKRRERKRAEGLMRKKLLEDQMNANESHHQAEPTEEFPYG